MTKILTPTWRAVHSGMLAAIVLTNGDFAVRTSDGQVLIVDPTSDEVLKELQPLESKILHIGLGGQGEFYALSTSNAGVGSSLLIYDEETLHIKRDYPTADLFHILCTQAGVVFGLERQSGNPDATMIAIRLRDGKPLWRFVRPSINRNLGVHSNRSALFAIVESDGVDSLSRIDPARGGGVAKGLPARAQALAVSETTVCVATRSEGEPTIIRAYDGNNLGFRWTQEVPQGPCRRLQIANGELYVIVDATVNGGSQDYVVSFNVETGMRSAFSWSGFHPIPEIIAEGSYVLVPASGSPEHNLSANVSYLRTGHDGPIFGNHLKFEAPLIGETAVFAQKRGDHVLVGTEMEIAVLDTRRHWAADLGAAARVRSAVQGTDVVAATSTGTLIRLDAQDGNIKWRRELGAPCNASPVIHVETVFAASGSTLFALNLVDGGEVFQQSADDTIIGEISVSGSNEAMVAFGTRSGAVVVVSVDTGQVVSSLNRGSAVTTPVLFIDDLLVVGGSDGQLSAFTHEGTETVVNSGQHEITGLIQMGQKIITTDAGGWVRAWSTTDWVEVWCRRLDHKIIAKGITPIDGEECVVTDSAGEVYKLNCDDGEPVWQINPLGSNVRLPLKAQDTLLVASRAGEVAFINHQDHQITNKVDLGVPIVSDIGHQNGIAIVADQQGALIRLVL